MFDLFQKALHQCPVNFVENALNRPLTKLFSARRTCFVAFYPEDQALLHQFDCECLNTLMVQKQSLFQWLLKF